MAQALTNRQRAIKQAVDSGYRRVSNDHQSVNLHQWSVSTLSLADQAGITPLRGGRPTKHFEDIAESVEMLVGLRTRNTKEPEVSTAQDALEVVEALERRLNAAEQPTAWISGLYRACKLMLLEAQSAENRNRAPEPTDENGPWWSGPWDD